MTQDRNVIEEFFSGDGPSVERLCVVIDQNSEMLARIANRIIVEGRRLFLLERLLHHLSEQEAADVLAATIAANSQAVPALIEEITLQFPQLLRPYFPEFFQELDDVNLPESTFWPWRGADRAEIGRLLEIADAGVEPQRSCAVRCLMETRHPAVVQAAWERVLALKARGEESAEQFDLESVDYGLRNTVPQPLYSGKPHHLVFPQGYPDYRESDIRKRHPTMRGYTPVQDVEIGGVLGSKCTLCGDPLHRLLGLDPAPKHLDLGVEALTVGACLSCLCFDFRTLFYAHAGSDQVQCLQQGDGSAEPPYRATPLLGTTATLHAAEPRWLYQSWGSGSHQNLYRLGGPPSWIQYPEYHPCPKCTETMHFAIQLDAGLVEEDGGWRDWGNGSGICYVLWCRNCAVSCLFSQCT